MHDVVLAFDADLAGGAGGLHGAGGHEVVVRDDLGLDEAALEVGVDDAGRLGSGRADRDRPGAGLLRPGGEERLQAEGVEADPDQLVEAGLVLADRGEQLGRVRRRQVGQLRLHLRVQEHRLGRCDQRPQRVQCGRIGQRFLVDVEDIQERLGGEQRQLAQRLEVDAGRGQRLPAVQDGPCTLDGREHRRAVLAQPGLLLQPWQRLVDGLQVGQDQLGVDRLDVVLRRDLTLDVHHVRVAEGADHLTGRVGLTDVGEELVAQALALARAAHQPGDVDERHRRRDRTGAVEQRGQLVEPGIRHAHDADVGVDRRERIVRGEHGVLGQRVEQGRLPDVREADDADRECHDSRVYGPRRSVPDPATRRAA